MNVKSFNSKEARKIKFLRFSAAVSCISGFRKADCPDFFIGESRP